MIQNPLNGFVLAGGKSSRMKRDKGFVYFQNVPLVQYSLQVLSHFCNKIYINANNWEYEKFGFEIITDTYLDAGPLGGLLTCLEISDTETNIFLPVDTPNVSKSLIQYLLKNSEIAEITIPVHQGRFEPLIGIYKTNVAAKIRALYETGNRKVIDIIKALHPNFLTIDSKLEFYHPDLFMNINQPDDIP